MSSMLLTSSNIPIVGPTAIGLLGRTYLKFCKNLPFCSKILNVILHALNTMHHLVKLFLAFGNQTKEFHLWQKRIAKGANVD
jgi:hypothetical protein